MKIEKDAGVDVRVYGSPEGWGKLEIEVGDLLTGDTVVKVSMEWDGDRLDARDAVRLGRIHLQEGVRAIGGYEVLEQKLRDPAPGPYLH